MLWPALSRVHLTVILGGLASSGVLGLYIARIFIETKHRPYSIVRAIHTFPASTSHDAETRPTRR
jgi:hypothetical protein